MRGMAGRASGGVELLCVRRARLHARTSSSVTVLTATSTPAEASYSGGGYYGYGHGSVEKEEGGKAELIGEHKEGSLRSRSAGGAANRRGGASVAGGRRRCGSGDGEAQSSN